MVILLVTETLAVGGAETFVVRLANRLAKDHTVVLANLHPEYSHADIVAQLDTRVHYRTPKLLAGRLRQKLDGVLLRLYVDGAFMTRSLVGFLTSLIQEVQPKVVHSHLFKTDYYVARTRRKKVPQFKHVTTNHGDYLIYHRSGPQRILRYRRKLKEVFDSVSWFVNISEEQMALSGVWKRQHLGSNLKVKKIPNGYENAARQLLQRSDLGLGDHELVFGMVARGIPEKGWGFLVDAFLRLNEPNTRLVLVGCGPVLDVLRTRYRNDNRIVFTGFAANPTAYVRLFDVGVLPSLYVGESLPTVVTEYLFCEKAVISTDIGEVRNMLRADGDIEAPMLPDEEMAGQLVPFPRDPQPDPGQLCRALRRYVTDPGLLARHQEAARLARRKFDMDRCVKAYVDLYETA
jgi:glycosyltransferase involved in cell wall biosynthesis